MATPAIQIEDVNKRYYLGSGFHGNLSQALEAKVRAPVRRLLGQSASHKTENEEFWALRDVSLDIARGSVFGIIGPNGAGKSTLLKMLARITSPTSGRITMHGQVGSLLEVGTGFHPELTGRENVFLNGAILGMGRREIAARYNEIVEFSGIEQFIETPVKRYSSGMYVRLAFAVAAHLDTEILLLDEVLAVGDADFQRRSLGKIDTAAADGRTVVFVTHDLNNVERLCDSCAWIDHGRLQKVGSTREVISAYLDTVSDRTKVGESEIPDDIERVTQVEGAKIRRVASLGADGAVSSRQKLGGRFSIRFEVEVAKPIEAAFEIGVNSFQEARLATAHNVDHGRPSARLTPGVHEIQADLDLDLLPGEFTIDIGIIDHASGHYYDLLERVLRLTVDTEPLSPSDGYPWGPTAGNVRASSQWSVNAAAEARQPAASATSATHGG